MCYVKNNQEQGFNMRALFIIGNGFDMAHGLPSSYLDFKKHLIKKYPIVLHDNTVEFDLYNYMNTTEEEYAAKLLILTMDIASGEEWNDFENALSKIHFQQIIPKDMRDRDDYPECILDIDFISKFLIHSASLWQKLFNDWVNTIEHEVEYGHCSYKSELKDLFYAQDSCFLSFNYTKVLQKKYEISKVIHIHNRVGQKLIFGHAKDNVMYNEPTGSNIKFISSSFLDDMLMSFKKDTVSPFKKYKRFFTQLDNKINRVYSYGFSYSKPDQEYIKSIINQISNNTIWYFTEYESRDKEALRIKKIKLRRYGFKGSFGIYNG